MTKLGYEQAEDTASKILNDFPYNESLEREPDPDVTHTDSQQQGGDKSKKQGYTRTEPVQTRSKSVTERKIKDSDKES